MKIASAATIIRFRHKRRRKGTSQSTKQASTGAAAVDQRIHDPGGSTIFAELAAVVVTVNVEFAALKSTRFSEVCMKLSVGRSCAPAGLAVTVALNATVPTKPLVGVTVTAVALDVPEPFVTTSELPAMAKVAPVGAVTVTVPDPDAPA
jgi:hypothetical protein